MNVEPSRNPDQRLAAAIYIAEHMYFVIAIKTYFQKIADPAE